MKPDFSATSRAVKLTDFSTASFFNCEKLQMLCYNIVARAEPEQVGHFARQAMPKTNSQNRTLVVRPNQWALTSVRVWEYSPAARALRPTDWLAGKSY